MFKLKSRKAPRFRTVLENSIGVADEPREIDGWGFWKECVKQIASVLSQLSFSRLSDIQASISTEQF